MKSVRIFFTIVLVIPLLLITYGQEKKKINIKKPNLHLGEKIGNLTAKLMTSKTADLSKANVTIGIISGAYDPQTKTTESKRYPAGTSEGDYLVYVSLIKDYGVGMYEVDGKVLCNGQPMEYLENGAYGYLFDFPPTGEQHIEIKTTTGDYASFLIAPIPEIDIISVNGDKVLPVIDLQSDLTIEYTNPPGSENTIVNIGLLSDVAGVRAVNYFSDSPGNDSRAVLSKDDFLDREIEGSLGAGKFNNGLNYLVLQRELTILKKDMDSNQKPGNISSPVIKGYAYASKPVIIIGKEEKSVLTDIRLTGKYNSKLGYDLYTPDSQHGKALSPNLRPAIISLNLNGKIYEKKTEEGLIAGTSGFSRYTKIWSKSTTISLPAISDESVSNLLKTFNDQLTTAFADELNIQLTPIENTISNPDYVKAFIAETQLTENRVTCNYPGLCYINPGNLGFIHPTKDLIDFIKSSGNNCLMAFEINFVLGNNKLNEPAIFPSLKFSVVSIDEKNSDRLTPVAEGVIQYTGGIPVHKDQLNNDTRFLSDVLDTKNLVDCLREILSQLVKTEKAIDYGKI